MTPGEREPAGHPRDRATLLDRVIGQGEPPAWWGVPTLAIGGCEVRVHLVAMVFVGAILAYALWNGLGVPFVLTGLLALALVVGTHEAARGHALVRWSGLRPVDVTLWPLGGVWRLDGDEPSDGQEARAAVTGMAATLAVSLVAGVAVALLTGDWTMLRFDPLRPGLTLAEIEAGNSAAALALAAGWQVYAAGLYVVALNTVPMLPLDVGLVVRAAGTEGTAARVGLGAGVVLVLGGMLTGLHLVAAVGLCGGVVSWHAWQSLRFAVDPAGVDRWRELLAGESGSGEAPIPPEQREEIERILAKISESGMGSLTRGERRQLARATEKLRRS